MKTLAQFKKENNIETIQLLQGKNRKFANINDLVIIVSKECDLTKSLFVVATTNQETGVTYQNAYTIVNSNVVEVEVL
jgi:hypothetical protein